MNASTTQSFPMSGNARRILCAAAAAALLMTSATAFADPPVSMAPPIDSHQSAASSPSQDTTFNWADVPQNQQVPLTRACFDKNGYQLFDTVGETIFVPFTDNNLYVMKFAHSTTGDMYFVNDNNVPTLYVPDGGYLENAAVSGAKWYPFSKSFHPAKPVFLGVAPSYSAYISMGWYPGMCVYAGYYRSSPWVVGAVVYPALAFEIFIGGSPYRGWGHYHDYCAYHPAPYHVFVVNRDVYHWGGRRYDYDDRFRVADAHVFRGGHDDWRGGWHGDDHRSGDWHSDGGGSHGYADHGGGSRGDSGHGGSWHGGGGHGGGDRHGR